MNHAPITANATFAATLCDQWWADGLTAAFVAPGSRSTPLALALVEHEGIRLDVMHDERSASFAALGHGLATGSPAVVLCSSGTAGAHFYAAVIEADASAVPFIAVTADRPPELWGRGAPQTIDQTHLYGTRVRAFVEPGPPDDTDPSSWGATAVEIWAAATGFASGTPGPVHANLSFRDPLTGTPGTLSPARNSIVETTASPLDPGVIAELADRLRSRRGVIVAGRGESDAADVLRLAELLGWPVLSDHRSGCRNPHAPQAIRHFDSLLRSPEFAERHRPDVVLRLGEIVSSKATSQWLTATAGAGAAILTGRPHRRNIDPEAIATRQFDEAGVVAALVEAVGERLAAGGRGSSPDTTDWLESWISADDVAARVIDRVLDDAPSPNEVAVARTVVDSVPSGGALVVASSMPVRDVEWFGPNRSDIEVYSNRGANGIDGTLATAIGIARTGTPTTCLVGDVAFLHDSTSLVALGGRDVDLTIVVTDNDGGAIFSFLPQHRLIDTAEYEFLFGTPHGTDLPALVAAHGLPCVPFDGPIAAADGARVVVARTDRTVNLNLHDRLHEAVAEALTSGGAQSSSLPH